MPLYEAPRWFRRELNLIDPTLSVCWHNKTCRWIIYHEDGSPSLIVENPKTHQFYPLDNRVLRKLRINTFFTHNPKALDRYIDEDAYALLSWMERGLVGVEDYLAGWV